MQGMVKMTVFAVGWLLLFMVHPATLQRDNEGEGRGRGCANDTLVVAGAVVI